ncbi:5035_t:CDS:1, partial [Dentiscutata heterogama]
RIVFELLYASFGSGPCTALAVSEPTYPTIDILGFSVAIALFQAVEPHSNGWVGWSDRASLLPRR